MNLTCVNCDKVAHSCATIVFCCEECAEQWVIDRPSDAADSTDSGDPDYVDDGENPEDEDYEESAPDSPGLY